MEIDKELGQKRTPQRKLNDQKYYLRHKERLLKQNLEYRLKNKEKRKIYNEKYNQLKKESKTRYNKEYNQNHREKIKKRQLLYVNKKYSNDLNFKIRKVLRSRLYRAIKSAKQQKNFKTNKIENLIGCSLDYFKQYIESKFLPEMNWDNHSMFGWHLDHIISCDKFNLTIEEERKKCFHYTNLQPLWAPDNLKKNNN